MGLVLYLGIPSHGFQNMLMLSVQSAEEYLCDILPLLFFKVLFSLPDHYHVLPATTCIWASYTHLDADSMFVVPYLGNVLLRCNFEHSGQSFLKLDTNSGSQPNEYSV